MPESIPLAIACQGARLQAILEKPDSPKDKAVLIVVGGPQYRVGSHRQFVLLSRHLAAHGFPVLRFDHRGIGDSDGSATFDALDVDIEAAIGALREKLPTTSEVIIWALCDGASAAMIYAARDPQVTGLVLLNPWIRDEKSLAQARFSGYYGPLLLSGAFWKRLVTGKVRIGRSVMSLLRNVFSAYAGGGGAEGESEDAPRTECVPFQKRMLEGIRSFKGNVLFILSGQDITATEFMNAVSKDRQWRFLKSRESAEWRHFDEANHTFSKREWRDRVAAWTLEWLEDR